MARLAVQQAAPAAPAPSSPISDTAHVVIVATTDVHGRVLGWDYVRDAAAPGGLSRAATIVEALRAQYPEQVVLVDAGDLIEGNLFAAYFAERDSQRPHPVVDALNAMQYDAATPGNHEFDFGPAVLARATGSGPRKRRAWPRKPPPPRSPPGPGDRGAQPQGDARLSRERRALRAAEELCAQSRGRARLAREGDDWVPRGCDALGADPARHGGRAAAVRATLHRRARAGPRLGSDAAREREPGVFRPVRARGGHAAPGFHQRGAATSCLRPSLGCRRLLPGRQHFRMRVAES